MSDKEPIPVYIVEKYPKPVNYMSGIGFASFLIGCVIPYWLGDHHDPFGQLLCGVVACIIGVIFGGIINMRMRRKKRKNNRGKR